MVDEFLMAREAKLRNYLDECRRLRALRKPAARVIRSILGRQAGAEWSATVGDWIGWALGTVICIASTILVLLCDRAFVTQLG